MTDRPNGTAQFDPHAVYSREALRSMLDGIVDVDRFLDRLQVPKRFKNCFLGADILRALENPPVESILHGGETPAAVTFGPVRVEKRGPGRPRKSSAADPLRTIRLEEVTTPLDRSGSRGNR